MSKALKIRGISYRDGARNIELKWGNIGANFEEQKRKFMAEYKGEIEGYIKHRNGLAFDYIEVYFKNYPEIGDFEEIRYFMALSPKALKELRNKYHDGSVEEFGAVVDNQMVEGRTVIVYDLSKCLGKVGLFSKPTEQQVEVLLTQLRWYMDRILVYAFTGNDYTVDNSGWSAMAYTGIV